MRKNIIYALCLAVLAAGFSACKKVESETINNSKTIVYKDGTVVEKNYKVTPGEPKKEETKPEVKEETPKRFFAFQAKRLLRKQLQKQNKERYVAVVRLGYYECNSYAERLNLLKLAANKLINLKVDEIMTANGPTYWVTASLTWRGWLLKEGPAKGLFPEDLITDEEAKAALLPSLDQGGCSYHGCHCAGTDQSRYESLLRQSAGRQQLRQEPAGCEDAMRYLAVGYPGFVRR